jgi:hypothetical protein
MGPLRVALPHAVQWSLAKVAILFGYKPLIESHVPRELHPKLSKAE